ncbi:Ycf51 family protein [Microcoleus sp. FACHB-68]|uniref:Ycf51 family protein n=1 Tax=Microcoleus sp. FACHB-68 TaxID=2692826 RepID=UPI0016825045|nr:Ycf51 family protein [Microcoleus sp. FACHB-68]MBD1940562.1 Ycf51 family protein [Microcoleus sp. FACHB-68]
MPTIAEFITATQWAAILTLACGVLTGLAFVFKWDIRFRLVGATGFMGVLTAGLFALTLVPITRTSIPGAIRFSTVYDISGPHAVIAVPPTITESELDATLRQAASNLFTPGRLGQNENQLTIRARTIIHPEPGVSEPLYIGQIKRSLHNRNDENMSVEIFRDKFAQLPQPEKS